jgi:hypothetical protein
MELHDALSLADFINGHGSRFCANVLDFGSRGWVIVADKDRDRYLEPISDPRDYVRRARQGILKIDDTYRDLLAEWVAKH